jgi:spore coat protein U-like protein
MRINAAKKAFMSVAVAGAVAMAGASAVNAATATENLGVGASVSVKCTITTSAIAFGVYDPIVDNATTPLDGTGTVSIACTKGATASIGLGNGLNGVRQMKDTGSNLLAYELYSNASWTTVWGNASGTWFTPVAAPSKAARPFTVYGRVASGQDVPAGAYTDTVVATVNF